MAYLVANDYGVTEATLTVPRAGRFMGELRLAASADEKVIQPGDKVSLVFESGQRYVSTCSQAGFDSGLWRIKVVGGNNALATILRPKYYSGIAARSIISDLITEAGEQPGEIQVAGVFERYVRLSQKACLALETVLHSRFNDHVWRTNPAGAIDVVRDNWPEVEKIAVTEHYPAERRVVAGARPELLPGVLLPGVGRVDMVRHIIGEQLRCEVFYL